LQSAVIESNEPPSQKKVYFIEGLLFIFSIHAMFYDVYGEIDHVFSHADHPPLKKRPSEPTVDQDHPPSRQ
jgi:hypothetical protein